jgi:membrane protease subunit HflK
MAGSGGPWGGGNSGGPDDEERGTGPGQNGRGPRKPQSQSGVPEIDEIMRKGQEQLRVLMGGRGKGGGTPNGGGDSGDGPNPAFSKQGLVFGLLAAAALWGFMSFYTVRPEEKSVELFLGKFSAIGEPGLNFAPWPLVTIDILPVTREQVTDVGNDEGSALGNGLMLTRDQNIVNIEFQVVWNIANPEQYLFNLADPAGTIKAVSESAMRDIIARSELAPILNRDRGRIASDLRVQVQETLDSYVSGINIVRVNFAKADPPREVIDAFRSVQAAQQERDRLEKEADAYANQVTAAARGQAAQLSEEAEAYRAQVVNEAEGDAARFLSVFAEYVKAPEVTRKRMYLETMERVLGGMNKVIMDGTAGGDGNNSGIVPILPLTDLGINANNAAAAVTSGGSN